MFLAGQGFNRIQKAPLDHISLQQEAGGAIWWFCIGKTSMIYRTIQAKM